MDYVTPQRGAQLRAKSVFKAHRGTSGAFLLTQLLGHFLERRDRIHAWFNVQRFHNAYEDECYGALSPHSLNLPFPLFLELHPFS